MASRKGGNANKDKLKDSLKDFDYTGTSSTNGTSANGSANGDNKMRSLTHHHEYYLVGGDLYIMIETTIFKIHSFFFRREAKNFYSKLLDPTSPGDDPKGMTESTAIIVDNATIKEFERFLWVFYNPKYDIYQAEIEDWFAILRLSSESVWDFPQVRRFALREIKRREDEIPLVRRIVLYRTYKAPPEYLVPLYAQLCSRPQSPTDEESRLLGFEEALKVFRAREVLRAEGGSLGDGGVPLSPLPRGKSEADTYPTIASVLGLPEYKPENDIDPDVVSVKIPKAKNVNGRTTEREKAEKEKDHSPKSVFGSKGLFS